MRTNRSLSALIATLVLVACGERAAPAPRSALHAPGSLMSRETPTPEALVAGGALGLTELLAFAEVQAPEVQVARGEVAAGQAEIEAAEPLSPYNPQLGGQLGGRTIAGVSRVEAGAQLSQRFQIAGQRGARLIAAVRTRDAAAAGLDAVAWSVHLRVHALYYQLLLRRMQRDTAERAAAFAVEVQAVTDRRIEAGDESPLTAMVIRAEVAQARKEAIAARLAEAETLLILKQTIGWPYDEELVVEGDLPDPVDVPDGSALVSRALREHPRRRQLDAAVAASEAAVEAEDLEAWPDPTLGVGYNLENEPGAVAHVWRGWLNVPIPIWQRNQAGRARARAAQLQAEVARDVFSQRLGPRVAQLVARVNAAAERVKVYGEDMLPAFENNLAKLQRAYELGEIDLLKLAQIRERVLSIQRDALAAQADYFQAAAALEQQAGVEVWGHSRSGDGSTTTTEPVP